MLSDVDKINLAAQSVLASKVIPINLTVMNLSTGA